MESCRVDVSATTARSLRLHHVEELVVCHVTTHQSWLVSSQTDSVQLSLRQNRKQGCVSVQQVCDPHSVPARQHFVVGRKPENIPNILNTLKILTFQQ